MDKKSQQSRKNYYEKNREKIGKNCMKKIKMEKKMLEKIGENSFLPCKEHVLAVQQSWTSSGLLTMMNP